MIVSVAGSISISGPYIRPYYGRDVQTWDFGLNGHTMTLMWADCSQLFYGLVLPLKRWLGERGIYILHPIDDGCAFAIEGPGWMVGLSKDLAKHLSSQLMLFLDSRPPVFHTPMQLGISLESKVKNERDRRLSEAFA